jgi:hypothetical protein
MNTATYLQSHKCMLTHLHTYMHFDVKLITISFLCMYVFKVRFSYVYNFILSTALFVLLA